MMGLSECVPRSSTQELMPSERDTLPLSPTSCNTHPHRTLQSPSPRAPPGTRVYPGDTSLQLPTSRLSMGLTVLSHMVPGVQEPRVAERRRAAILGCSRCPRKGTFRASRRPWSGRGFAGTWRKQTGRAGCTCLKGRAPRPRGSWAHRVLLACSCVYATLASWGGEFLWF
jgi:hypothetical protein